LLINTLNQNKLYHPEINKYVNFNGLINPEVLKNPGPLLTMSHVPQKVNNFRFDINALRAIAVSSVLLFHYKVKYFAGGFSGVDIFFVISGYLMTRIIYNAINQNNFSFADFYGRRLKRIAPALISLVAGVVIACFFLYFPTDYNTVAKNGAASLLFLSNILYWLSTDYFSKASGDNVFLHTWSLSVEWQFYLLYPLLLLIFNKLFKNKKVYLICFLALTIVGYIGSTIVTGLNQTISFYLLPTRSWEMLFGGIAFLSEDLVKAIKWKKYLALIGYILIAYCVFMLNSDMAWPGKVTLLPVVATFLVIVANDNDFWILKNNAIQFTGKISYSLYLWHWPVFVMAEYAGINMTFWTTIALVALVILLAYISYTFIENRAYKRNNLIIAAGIFCVFVTALLATVELNRFMFKSSTVDIAGYPEKHTKQREEQFDDGGCSLNSNNDKGFNKQLCLNYESGKKNVLLLGDSHAAQLSQSLREAFSAINVNMMQANASGCFPTIASKGRKRCTDLNKFIFNTFLVKEADKINAVIISANWASKLRDTIKLANDLQRTINFLIEHNLRPVLIGQNEGYSMRYPYIAARENEYGINIAGKYLDENTAIINKFLSNKFKKYYIEIYNSQAPKVNNNVPYMFDRDHLSKYGADLATIKILASPIIKNALIIKPRQ
jgi:peptidoglycan/LPS O-acetylase OafA/YrhL